MLGSARMVTLGALLSLFVVLPVVAQTTPGNETSRHSGVEKRKGDICIDIIRIRRTRVIDDNTILFYLRGGEIYVNELNYRCPGLGFEQGFSYATSLTQLCCNREIIRVLRRGTACGLGEFTKINAKTAEAIIAGDRLDPSHADDDGPRRRD